MERDDAEEATPETPDSAPDGRQSHMRSSPPQTPQVQAPQVQSPQVQGLKVQSSGDEGYQVRLPMFEGPLDLLLHLVKKHELDVLNIPIAFITEKYTAYIKLLDELNIDIASEYLLMAATLVHLKSRLLLPNPPEEEADEGLDAATKWRAVSLLWKPSACSSCSMRSRRCSSGRTRTKTTTSISTDSPSRRKLVS
jgi:hypothetical protein